MSKSDMNETKKNQKRIGTICVILAACLWGTMGIFVRFLNGVGLGSMEIVEGRSIIAAVFLFVIVAIQDIRLNAGKSKYPNNTEPQSHQNLPGEEQVQPDIAEFDGELKLCSDQSQAATPKGNVEAGRNLSEGHSGDFQTEKNEKIISLNQSLPEETPSESQIEKSGVSFSLNRSLLRIKLSQIPALAGSGILSIVFFNYCYFSTISMMNLSAAAILLYTSPIFVMLMSLIFFKEKLTARKIVALVLAFAGCCLVSGIASASESLSAAGILLGLGSGFGYALYSIFSRISLNLGLSSITITVYTFIFAAIGGAVFTNFGTYVSVLKEQGIWLLGFFVLYCLITTVAPYLLYTKGLEYVENGPASIMASVEPVVATILGVFVFSESLTASAIIGMVLVLGALVLLSIHGNSKNSRTMREAEYERRI